MRHHATATLTALAMLATAWPGGDPTAATAIETARVPAATSQPASTSALPVPGQLEPAVTPLPQPVVPSAIAARELPDDRFHHPPDKPFWSRVWRVNRHPIRHHMRGVTWRPGCPVALRDLRYVRLRYVRFDGSVHVGGLVVHKSAVRVVLPAMRRLYTIGYPIRRIKPMHHYDGDDDASMADNNTSAFNCRRVAGTDRWSRHAYGLAVDVNPRRNPYVTSSGEVSPPNGRTFADRSNRRPGMLYRWTRGVKAFTNRGWGWGGDWQYSKDWQHFSADGH